MNGCRRASANGSRTSGQAAPASFACAIIRETFSKCCMFASGPSRVAGSIGSPGFKAFARSTMRATNASFSGVSTIRREPATHVWPFDRKMPDNTPLTALSILTSAATLSNPVGVANPTSFVRIASTSAMSMLPSAVASPYTRLTEDGGVTSARLLAIVLSAPTNSARRSAYVRSLSSSSVSRKERSPCGSITRKRSVTRRPSINPVPGAAPAMRAVSSTALTACIPLSSGASSTYSNVPVGKASRARNAAMADAVEGITPVPESDTGCRASILTATIDPAVADESESVMKIVGRLTGPACGGAVVVGSLQEVITDATPSMTHHSVIRLVVIGPIIPRQIFLIASSRETPRLV